MKFFLSLLILVLLIFYTGCSGKSFSFKSKENNKKELLSCEQKAKPKSLQFLEQQYRCKSQN